MAKSKAQAETKTTETAVEQDTSAPSLTLQDLVTVAQVIQITSQRGAFRAEELANVGTLYNKLVAFLESSGAISRQPVEGAEEMGHA